MLETVQAAVHGISVVVIGITVIVIVIACAKPQLFKQLFHEFTERKYILSVSIFAILLSGTIYVATEPVHKNTFSSGNGSKSAATQANSLETPQNTPQSVVKIVEDIISERIPFTSHQQDDPTLAIGQTKLVQAGKNGVKETTYSVTYSNDTETSRILKGERISVEPQPEITAVGSLQPLTTPAATPAQTEAAKPEQHKQPEKDKCKNSRSWTCGYLFWR